MSMGAFYLPEEDEYIQEQIGKGRAVEDWIDEYNDRFKKARTLDALKQRCRRLGLSTSHLQPASTSESFRMKSVQAKSTRIETAKRLMEMSEDELRQMSIVDEAKKRKSDFDKADLRRLRQQEPIRQQILDTVAQHVTMIREPKYTPAKTTKRVVEESAMLNIGDAHVGEVVAASSTGGFNEYNFDIFVARMNRLIAETIKYTTNTLQGYRFKTSYVNFLGDIMSGMIHDELLKSPNMPVIEAVVKAAPVIAAGIAELEKHFETVHVTWIEGNHGRYTKKVEYKNPNESIEYMFGEMVRLWIKDHKRVVWNIKDSIFTDIEVEGYRFLLMHGESITSWMGVPYYGIDRAVKKLVALYAKKDQFIDYFIFGHFHVTAVLDQVRGEAMLNGSLKGADEYSLGKFHSFSRPCQWLFGVHRNHGVTWRLPIDLG